VPAEDGRAVEQMKEGAAESKRLVFFLTLFSVLYLAFAFAFTEVMRLVW